jgi:hypothetical protein
VNKKEVAKFLSGFAAHEALSHTLLSGSGLLPLNVLGFTVTVGYNAGIILFWWIALILLMRYAWVQK